jgi:hypothetical protein
MDRVLTVFKSPEDAEHETRRQYRLLTPDERLALTVQLQRRYYEQSDAPGRLSRVLTVLERS